MIDRPIRLDQRTPASGELVAARYILAHSHTTRVEKCLLFTSIVLLPLENYFLPVAGMSLSFLVFVALAAYAMVNRPRILGEMCCHPVFIATYAFIGVTALLELSSPLSTYDSLIRFTQMIGGALCVAVLCRDRSALTVILCAYIVTALWTSVVLFSTGYGTLQGSPAEDFGEATELRQEAFGHRTMGADLNGLAIYCAQGAIVSFALSLSDRLKHLRLLLVGISAFCLIASFLLMSRGAAAISLVSFAIILYAHGVKHGKALILVLVLGVGVYAVVPDAVWSRMVYSTETRDGKMEARASLYDASLNRLPEYIMAGVGWGNFLQKWGLEKGFARHGDQGLHVQPAHNSPLQITINWGILGLGMFLLIVWCAYRSVPLDCGRDGLSLAVLGIMVSLGLSLLHTHSFYAKEFSFPLGMLVGSRRWIWPNGVVSAVEVNQGPSPHSTGLVPTKQ